MGTSRLLTAVARRYLPPGSGVLFSSHTRRRLVLVLVGSILLSAIEMLGMFLLLLLMRQLTASGARLGTLEGVVPGLGDLTDQQVVAVLGAAVLTVFTAKTLLGVGFRRWVLRYVGQLQADTARRLLAGYMHGPYHRVASKNTAYFIRTMYDGTSSVYGLVIAPLIQSAVELFTLAAVLAFLLVVMPIPALVALTFFGVAVWILNVSVRGHALRAGEVLVEQGVVAYGATLHAIGGIKEIKVRNTQDHFVEQFRQARSDAARAGATSVFLSELPKYVIEWIFIVATLLTLTVLGATTDPDETLPLMAVFVAAGVRVLPSASRLVAMASTIRTGLPQMETVISDLIADLPATPEARPGAAGPRTQLTIQDSLEVDTVSFAYPGSADRVLNEVTFTVNAGQAVAITGPSGSGKSTLVDIVLGLQVPDSGALRVDGRPIHSDLPRWQRSIGLVPQDVFLLDDTLRNNVTLGVAGATGDDAVLEALHLAHLDEMVAQLPDGIDTRLGERGSRVSGGQRQRIGIARALFTRPSLLVLDEATSALDNDTERRIGETLDALHGRVTTLIVAHRLSTVRSCDAVLFLEGGRITAAGTFDQVVDASASFAHLVELGKL
jgi:ABC-type multidrug transport system fused ATPase/permease subunit